MILQGKFKQPFDFEKYGMKLKPGEWDDESDYYFNYTLEDSGNVILPIYFIQRNLHFAYCGYVYMPPTYKAYKKILNAGLDKRSNLNEMFIVHGGVTFFDNRFIPDRIKKHTDMNVDNTGYWIGFDCAHYNDLCPAIFDSIDTNLLASDPMFGLPTYKNLDCVINECESLVEQLGKYDK